MKRSWHLLRFHKGYFLLATGLLLLLVLVALFVNDRFIRPTAGDFLVVIFLYVLVRAFSSIRRILVAVGVWVFAILVEALQGLDLIHWLGLQDNPLARVILGTSFDWKDLLAYTCGILVVLLMDRQS